MNGSEPYRLPRAVLRALTNPRFLEEIEGDLDEEFRERMTRMSPFRARLADAFHALSLIRWYSRPHLDFHSLASAAPMLKNYVRFALRSSRKQAGYTALNLAGLAMGLACFLIVSVYIGYHVSFDRFHEKADDLYRLTKQVDGSIQAGLPAGLAPILADGTADIRAVVRVSGIGERIVSLPETRSTDRRFKESGLMYTDPAFLTIFDFPLVSGDPNTVLEDPASIVLTTPMARKYFGDEDPMGQQLILDNKDSFTVTGVLAELPRDTAFEFDFLVPFDLLQELMGHMYEWQSLISTYVLLESGVDPANIADALPEWAARYTDRAHVTEASYYLQPVTDIHLHPGRYRFDQKTPVSPLLLRIFGLIGLVVLGLACINYVNLATARSIRRAREVGLRKAVGAGRRQITFQFLTESVLTSLVAGVLAFGIAWVALPWLAQDLAIGLHRSLLLEEPVLWMAFAVSVGIGVVSGSYPAWHLSKMTPHHVLKGDIGGHSPSMRFVRRGLIVFQFTVSVFLLVGVLAIQGQLNFMNRTNLGFDKDSTMALPLSAPGARDAAQPLMDRILHIPGVKSASLSSGLPGIPNVYQRLDLSQAAIPKTEDTSIALFFADADVLETLNMNVVSGEGFSTDVAKNERSALINQTTANLLGWEDPLGRSLPAPWGDDPFTITGVVEDFHFESLRTRIGPAAILPTSAFIASYVVIRFEGESATRLQENVRAAWTAVLPEIPFDVVYLDQMFRNMYRTESRQAQLLFIFSGIALFIAILGIIGLASYSAERRRKELGIRRVLGASTTGLVALLNREFLLLVLIACLVGFPVAYLFTEAWLDSFAYRIPIGVGIFLWSGSAVMTAAFLASAFQSIRAALAPPAQVIRTE